MNKIFSIGAQLFAMSIALFLCCPVMSPAADLSEVPYVEGKQPPPDPVCRKWCLSTTPAVYKTVYEKVQVCPASTYNKVIPAVYGTKNVQIMVKPASKYAVWVPAVWKRESVKQLVREASTTYRIIPATFKSEIQEIEVRSAHEAESFTPPTFSRAREQVMVRPETTKIKNSCGPCGQQTSKTIKVPAKYACVRKHVMRSPGKITKCPVPAVTKKVRVQKLLTPARVETVTIPACYTTIQRKVLVKNGYYRMYTIPAKFASICVNTIVKPTTQQSVPVPATFKTIKRRQLVTPEKKVWRLVKAKSSPCRSTPCGCR